MIYVYTVNIINISFYMIPPPPTSKQDVQRSSILFDLYSFILQISEAIKTLRWGVNYLQTQIAEYG